MNEPKQVDIENVNVPGRTTRVDRARYEAMREALLALLPDEAPGLTHAEIVAAVPVRLDERLFPGGAKCGWWSKTVQLDLEAKGLIDREATKPARWHRRRA